ncbi:kinase-like protein [Schizopora paradoxa]|uniref:non-specific serine/threonine protein kinase n=1 Tax=Schizopora paradoxa TaxID=27342 RepID=A0A0H2RRT2_9AGAM|nr:kinase-like protein [Schizopora paradoxa]
MAMATPMLLSHHSSNPLEMDTSDEEARYMVTQIRETPSTDPLNEEEVDDQQYLHITPKKRSVKVNGVPTPFRIQPKPATTTTGDVYSDGDSDLEIVDDEEEVERWHRREDTFVQTAGDMVGMEEEMEVAPEREASVDALDEEDEENTLQLKPPEEQEEILEEIEDLENAVPQLTDDYKIIDRLGTGTFSSVYKAVDLYYHSKWHNKSWHGRHPRGSSAHFQSLPRPPGSKVFVAIKRIYVTSNPERIKNEIVIMEDCLGCRHVAQLITAFRHHDQVVAIMPYQRNEDFRDYFKDYPMVGIRAYMRCLFRALRDIHARDIVHRDVKPANFLFDSRKHRGTLCDFGLAARVGLHAYGGDHCFHTSPSMDAPHGRTISNKDLNTEAIKIAQKEARYKSMLPSDRVGYPEKDLRPVSKANRAGTRGFRAPEVLLKCNDQSGAIDVWSAGMILLFFLTGKFPLFQSNDDIEALMEIASIIGKKRMEKAATLHNRTFATNVPSVTQDGMTWREFVQRNNPDLFRSQSPPPSATPSTSPTLEDGSTLTAADLLHPPDPSSSQSTQSLYSTTDLNQALDLLERLLHPSATDRITARNALYHPFLVEPGPGDDAFFPHPLGKGRCGEYHFRDAVTEEHHAKFVGPKYDETRRMNAGEGIPIGDNVCELHRGMPEFL